MFKVYLRHTKHLKDQRRKCCEKWMAHCEHMSGSHSMWLIHRTSISVLEISWWLMS